MYGEVIDGILKETSSKAIEDNKIKVAGQPKNRFKNFWRRERLRLHNRIRNFTRNQSQTT